MAAALDLAEQLTARGKRTDSITAAAIYHCIDAGNATLLLDEADNLDAAADKLLKAVLNAGHRRGGKRMHMVRGMLQELAEGRPVLSGDAEQRSAARPSITHRRVRRQRASRLASRASRRWLGR